MSDGSNKTIKVGFIVQQTSAWMGGLNYFKNLFIALSKIDNPKIVPYILPPEDKKAEILLEYAQVLNLKNKKDWKYYLIKSVTQLKGGKFNKDEYFIENLDIDIDLISYSSIIKDKPTISWIPDFQHLHLKELFDKEELIFRNNDFLDKAKNSEIVVLSSEDALNDFVKFAPEYAYKGRVLNFVAILEDDVYRKTGGIKEVTISKFNLPEKYFYLPNQFWKHKNHQVVFEAISILKEQGIDIKVIFSGTNNDYRHANYFDELMKYAKDKNIGENINLVGLIDLIEVYFLMRNCISIINPSLFEGWSSTVEEAKSLGKNTILSDLNVHREQNPSGAIYFDPHNPEDLAEILKEKWLNCKSEPDYELEKIAEQKMQERIIQFGEAYQKIALEALGNKDQIK